MKANIRKIATFVEETRNEMGRAVDPPTRRAAAVAVIENPYAGNTSKTCPNSWRLARNWESCLPSVRSRHSVFPEPRSRAMGKRPQLARMERLEHAAAILHPKLGTPVRKVLGKGAALIPSSKKRGGLGVALDIPLGHKDAAFVRSHFDGMEVRINDAPRANEIMVAVAVTDSGRPLPRVGGLTKAEIKGEDGLR